jgi:hypothetical protein
MLRRMTEPQCSQRASSVRPRLPPRNQRSSAHFRRFQPCPCSGPAWARERWEASAALTSLPSSRVCVSRTAHPNRAFGSRVVQHALQGCRAFHPLTTAQVCAGLQTVRSGACAARGNGREEWLPPLRLVCFGAVRRASRQVGSDGAAARPRAERSSTSSEAALSRPRSRA